ncbi:hypothetical protein HY994_04445 [Candidatus Micrarchaeota archaeon]|nr:hypothetical protein [Candidatus Micrarchaeota archaeon]
MEPAVPLKEKIPGLSNFLKRKQRQTSAITAIANLLSRDEWFHTHFQKKASEAGITLHPDTMRFVQSELNKDLARILQNTDESGFTKNALNVRNEIWRKVRTRIESGDLPGEPELGPWPKSHNQKNRIQIKGTRAKAQVWAEAISDPDASEAIHLLRKHVQTKLETALNELRSDEKISALLQKHPHCSAILRLGLLSGEIPGTNGSSAAWNMLQKAMVSSDLTTELEQRVPLTNQATPSARRLQKRLWESIERCGPKCLTEPSFRVFAHRMGHELRLLGRKPEELEGNPATAKAFAEHVITEYELLRELQVSPTIIKNYGHVISAFHADSLINNAILEFGTDEKSKPLAKTAFNLVVNRRYPDMKAAKKAYDECLEFAKNVFGSQNQSAAFVRTAAMGVFTGRFKDVNEFKETYDNFHKRLQTVSGPGLQNEYDRRRAAMQLAIGNIRTIKEAENLAPKYNQRVGKTSAALQMELPAINGLERNEAFEKMMPIIKDLGRRFMYSALGREDAEQTAALAALESLHQGERNVETISAQMLRRVYREARIYRSWKKRIQYERTGIGNRMK